MKLIHTIFKDGEEVNKKITEKFERTVRNMLENEIIKNNRDMQTEYTIRSYKNTIEVCYKCNGNKMIERFEINE